MGIDVRTVRKVLRQKTPRPYEWVRKGSPLLAGFEDWIRSRVAAVGYCAQSIYEEIRGQGYKGSYDVVRRFADP
jgi:transposase